MPFRERTAWVMGLLLVLAGGVYLKLVLADGVAPTDAAFPFAVGVTVLAVITQILLAAVSPREASEPGDERERLVLGKAARVSSSVFATGVVMGLGAFMITGDGMQLFHIALLSLVLGTIADYAAQIIFLRSGG